MLFKSFSCFQCQVGLGRRQRLQPLKSRCVHVCCGRGLKQFTLHSAAAVICNQLPQPRLSYSLKMKKVDLFLETLFVRPWSTSRSTWTDENTKNTVVRSVHRCCFSHFFTLFHTRSSVSNCFPGFPGSPGVSSQKVQRVSQKVRES